MVANGRLADLALEIKGWELVVTGTDDGIIVALGLDAVTAVADGRLVIDLPVDRSPDQLLPELGRHGLRVVSLTPRHESLEDFFMRLVEHPPETG